MPPRHGELFTITGASLPVEVGQIPSKAWQRGKGEGEQRELKARLCLKSQPQRTAHAEAYGIPGVLRLTVLVVVARENF